MQRYFIEEHKQKDTYTITGDDARHISKVLRMKTGNEIIVCLTTAQSARCQIDAIHSTEVDVSVTEWLQEDVELPIQVTIVSGLPKGDKLEWIIQKGTELGAAQFLPFAAKRSIVKWDAKKGAKKLERFSKIAKEAAEQSHRTVVPTVEEPVTIQQLIKQAEAYTHKIVAYEEVAKESVHGALFSVLKNCQKGDKIMAVFGPEGGLTEDEVSLLTNHGFVPCSLGARIVRTETAPLYVLSAVSYHFEIMR